MILRILGSASAGVLIGLAGDCLFDRFRYGPDGYNQRGYDRAGYDRSGFDKKGYDKNGFNQKGFDRDGYNKDGYDKRGYDRQGFDLNGFNRRGFDKSGFNKDGFDREGYGKDGYNGEGYNKQGFNRQGYNRDGFDKQGFNRQGYNRDGFDEQGYDCDGFNLSGYNRYGFKRDGSDRAGKTINDYSKLITLIEKDKPKIYKSLDNHELRHASTDIRVNLEKAVSAIVEHWSGEKLDKLDDNITMCKKNGYLEKDFCEKLYGAKNHCNDSVHDTCEKETDQIFFSAKVLEETIEQINGFINPCEPMS